MLVRVEITDFALIDHTVLEADAGLLMMTGETGAGKSILIDAISALCGSRMRRDMIRHGCERAVIEAMFEQADQWLPERLWSEIHPENDHAADEEEAGCLILSREFQASGRSICRINGRLVPLNLLRDCTSYLIDIHGQHDQQAIFRTETHIQLLDRFAGEPVSFSLGRYQRVLQAWRETRRQLKDLGADPSERARMLDMLQYQTKEIEAARIQTGEDETLTARRRLLAHAEKIQQALILAYDRLNGDDDYAVMTSLGIVNENIASAAVHTRDLDETAEQIDQAMILLQTAAEELREWTERSELDPAELIMVDERLDLLYRLKNKYGGSIESVLDFYEKASDQLDHLADGEAEYERLTVRLRQLEEKLVERAAELSQARRQAAAELEKRLMAELKDLGMPAVRFAVQISDQARASRFQANGFDLVEFSLSANPGEPLKPLTQIASGGEASRMMLAIKVILAEADQIPVLIFDEIDAGVSGHTADRVAEKLLHISRHRQVFCITHLAQLAAMADRHLLIEKRTRNDRTSSHLTRLSPEQRREELGRLLSGGVGQQQAITLAGQLLEQAETLRSRWQLSPCSFG